MVCFSLFNSFCCISFIALYCSSGPYSFCFCFCSIIYPLQLDLLITLWVLVGRFYPQLRHIWHYGPAHPNRQREKGNNGISFHLFDCYGVAVDILTTSWQNLLQYVRQKHFTHMNLASSEQRTHWNFFWKSKINKYSSCELVCVSNWWSKHMNDENLHQVLRGNNWFSAWLSRVSGMKTNLNVCLSYGVNSI